MTELGIDIETFSSVDIKKSGVYRYAEAPDFEILLFAYSVDNGPVAIVDLAMGESLPEDVERALTDGSVAKTAFNAAFERICIGKWLERRGVLPPGARLDPAQWHCTMVAALRMGLPGSLAECGAALGLGDKGKMEEGKNLIALFSKLSPKGVRCRPEYDPDKWALFKKYCVRDVEVEQVVLAKVRSLPVPSWERELYVADQEINDRGVLLDLELVRAAVKIDTEYREGLMAEARRLTGLENPNSRSQLIGWLENETPVGKLPTLRKADLDELEERLSMFPKPRRVLAIRRELGKTSNAKWQAMLNCACADGRAHGLLQFYGASRTGRWAGRLIQLQNLPQNHLDDIDFARSVTRSGDIDEMGLEFERPTQVLSELIRTGLIAKEGHTFHVCDFSAIEARVIAWLAGEDWVLEAFRAGKDIYCETASQMFHCKVEKHGENAGLRQKGKIAVLALGYGGGVSALEAMGGARMGLSEEEMREIIHLWRGANKRIVSMWSKLERAAISAVNSGRTITANRGLEFSYSRGCLFVKLPSGRVMCYPRAKVEIERDDGWRGDHESLTYEGVNQTSKKWGRVRTYGGKLTENIVQATARDILGCVLLRARDASMDVVFHVHDEIIVEAPPYLSLGEVEKIFSMPIGWCRGLPLKGAGYSTPYYLKD